MTTMASEIRKLPKSFALKGRDIVLQRLRPTDHHAMVQFAQQLPLDSLLFLRQDITRAPEVTKWIEESLEGHVITIVAWETEQIVGYATLDRGRARWTRHVAEIQVVVSESGRGIGIGRHLLELAFEHALAEGVQKVIARMTPDQDRAIALFENLGFTLEATLPDHAIGLDGKMHDLVLFAFHRRRNQDRRCESCGTPVLAGFSLGTTRLCSFCFESQYQELGGGD